ncbi:hypothetical protein Q5530_03135 [Saccharothrix sp. BKS2]|uniref:hypothetical protein n=1 Tax=Saccharothrix sp. BKS2 TaxID=3064400 RepID=UPI0039ECC208
MILPGVDTLVIEQPWGVGRHLFGSRYEVRVHAEGGEPLATVTDRGLLGPLRRLLRLTGFSGRTGFALALAHRGQPLLLIDKGRWRPPTRVAGPDGAPLGAVRLEGRGAYALLDPAGQRVALFHEVASFGAGAIAERDGKRVRRDVLRLRPGTPEPLRSLAIATAVAYDVVRGAGTNHTGSGGFDFPTPA